MPLRPPVFSAVTNGENPRMGVRLQVGNAGQFEKHRTTVPHRAKLARSTNHLELCGGGSKQTRIDPSNGPRRISLEALRQNRAIALAFREGAPDVYLLPQGRC